MAMLPDYKEIVDLIKKGANLEAQEKILELRAGAVRLQEENIDLKEYVKKLEDDLTVKDKLYYEAPYYWLSKGDDKDGPYCQHCYDKNKDLIRLQVVTKGLWRCMACNTNFKDKDYSPPKKIQRRQSDWVKGGRW